MFSSGASQRIPIFSVGASREIHFFGWCLPKNSYFFGWRLPRNSFFRLVPPKEFLFFRLVPPEKFIFLVGASQRIPVFSCLPKNSCFLGWCLGRNSFSCVVLPHHSISQWQWLMLSLWGPSLSTMHANNFSEVTYCSFFGSSLCCSPATFGHIMGQLIA